MFGKNFVAGNVMGAFLALGAWTQEVQVVPLFPEDIVFKRPVWVGEMPGMANHFVVLEQHEGRVALVRPKDGKWVKEDFYRLGVSKEGECGLLGIAFHPRFRENRKYYLQYNPMTGSPATIIEEREAGADFLRDSGKSGRQVLRVPQEHDIHQGGQIAFGPKDGMLYVGLGDGGDSKPAQDPGDLRGKMLRIDVDGGRPYAVPADNPFVGTAGARPEIYALGLRNPWRWSFDPATGEIWAGDVGETAREEITMVPKGGNLGWDRREGKGCRGGLSNCVPAGEAGLIDPLYDYDRGGGAAVVGGHVYRGKTTSTFFGTYFFADFFSGEIRMLRPQGDGPPEVRTVAKAPGRVSSFGLDASGSLYLAGHEDGAIWRLRHPELETSIRPRAGRRPEGNGLVTWRLGQAWRLPGDVSGPVEVRDPSGRRLADLSVEEGAMRRLDLRPGLYHARDRAGVRAWRVLLLP